MNASHCTPETKKIHRIKCALHTHGKNGSWHCYNELMSVIVRIDQRGEITNKDLNILRQVLEQIGLVEDALNETPPKLAKASSAFHR